MRYRYPGFFIFAVLLCAASAYAVNFQSNVIPQGALQGQYNATAPTITNGNFGVGQVDATSRLFVSNEGNKSTYRYNVQGITPVATPTDVLLIQGSSTMTVRIKRIVVNGIATTAGQMPFQVIRRSSAGTKGSATLTAITAGQHDINQASPTASVSYVQTANYTTVGTGAGVLDEGRVYLNVSGTGASSPFTLDYASRNDYPLVLRGTSDFVAVNFGGATVPSGGALDFTIETEEDNS